MIILRAGLYLAMAVACLATWLSWQAGYQLEVATVRGVVAFMAVSFIAYLAELVVMTAPMPRGRARVDTGSDGDPGTWRAGTVGTSDEPVNLPAVRAARDAAGDSRAA